MPFLESGFIFTILHAFEKWLVLIKKLYIWVIGKAKILNPSLRKRLERLTIPGPLHGEMSSRSFKTPISVKDLELNLVWKKIFP